MPIPTVAVNNMHSELKLQMDDQVAALKAALDAYDGSNSTAVDNALQSIQSIVANDMQILRLGAGIAAAIAER